MIGNYYKQVKSGVEFKVQSNINGELICRVINSTTTFYLSSEAFASEDIIEIDPPEVDLTKSAQIRGTNQITNRSLY